MSKMKHLLRKLHLGGGGDHHNHDRLANPSTTSTNPPPLPQPASSSSSSSSSSSVSSSVGSSSSSSRAAEVAETRENGSAAGLAVMAVGGSDNGDFSIFEEEYQVQLALAISASDPDGLEDADAVQMKAATQMSLSCAPAAVAAAAIGGGGDENRMEYLSVQYWTYNVVNYDEKLMDGFYDVYGIMSSHQLQGQMPSLVDLQATSVSDNIEYEVVVVNRTRDPALQQLERKALSIALQSREAQVGPIASGLVQKIANLVVDNMGGPVADAEDILRRWTIKSHELRTLLKTIVLPLGLLEVGLSRHRALLFKVLADRINLPCRLVKGSYYTGTDEGAVNFIKIDYDGEYIIDLMGAPGTLIPAEFPSSHLQDSGLNLFTSNTIEEKVKDLCSALDNIKVRGNASYNSSVPEIFDPRPEEKPGDYPSPEVDSLMGGDQGKRFEHESGEVPPLGGSQADEQGGRASASTGWQTKVDGVSKCVVSAERNPEFAQKLPAVLRESGAPPPQDFFSDINPLQDSAEQDSGKSVCTVGEMEKDGKLYQDKSARIQPSFMLSTEAESFNCAVYKAKKLNLSEEMTQKPSEDANVNKNPIGTQFHSCFPTTNEGSASVDIRVNDISYADSKAEGPSLVLDAAVVSEDASKNESPMPFGGDLGQDQCVGALEAPKCSQEVAGRSVANLIGTKDNDALKDYQESASESLAKCKGPANKGMLMLSGATNKRSHPIMDDVAEWEIPWEDLQIGERIGLGSYGEVYRADWNGTEVAVKKFLNQDLSGDALEQFRYEVKIMLRLRHPNVVLFMGAVTRPPNLSILTEFLPRGSLFRLLHRPNIQIDEKRRLKMALDVARGMNYLHSSHPTIVHRDLKSPNLLVDRNWVVKVCDFGLSRLKHHTFLSSKSTAGTPEWMAPEVLRNEPSNEKCDVYSFGVILWELATLSMPWSGMNPMQVVGAVGFQDRRLDIPKEVDPMVAQIISDCWQSEPNQRPSFAQLMSPLRQLQRLAVATS